MPEDPTICSDCRREIPPDDAGRLPPLCPHCGAMRIIDDDDKELPEEAEPQEQELEERRIRQIVRGRRAVVRTRGWYIAAALACLILAVQQIGWFVMAMVQKSWDVRQIARLSLAIVLLGAVVLLHERIQRLTAELRRKTLPEPSAPPDFSSLSDGSQQVRNLEEMDRDDGGRAP